MHRLARLPLLDDGSTMLDDVLKFGSSEMRSTVKAGPRTMALARGKRIKYCGIIDRGH